MKVGCLSPGLILFQAGPTTPLRPLLAGMPSLQPSDVPPEVVHLSDAEAPSRRRSTACPGGVGRRKHGGHVQRAGGDQRPVLERCGSQGKGSRS